MKIEMGKLYRNKDDGEILKPICIDRDDARYPVVMESVKCEFFSTFTSDGKSIDDYDPCIEEYTPEPELITMDGVYLSNGREVNILTTDSGHYVHPVVAMFKNSSGEISGPSTFTKTGKLFSDEEKSDCDLIKIGEKKAKSVPEMVVYKVRYHNPDRGCYETGVIASPAESLYSWLSKIGPQHESVEKLEDIKYTGNSIETVIIG